MSILTGADGQLKYGDKIIGKARNFSLDVSRDSIETTPLGVFDRTYTNGIRGSSGSASLYYDPTDSDATSFVNTILSNTDSETVSFVMDKSGGGNFTATGFLTGVGLSVSVGEAQACEIRFQITGPITGAF